jgi:hypothetical protein
MRTKLAFLLPSALGLALLLPAASQAFEAQQLPRGGQPQLSAKPKTPYVVNPEVTNQDILFCWTCGGHYNQTLAHVYTNGYNNRVYEAGPGCSGGVYFRWDNDPYICGHQR